MGLTRNWEWRNTHLIDAKRRLWIIYVTVIRRYEMFHARKKNSYEELLPWFQNSYDNDLYLYVAAEFWKYTTISPVKSQYHFQSEKQFLIKRLVHWLQIDVWDKQNAVPGRLWKKWKYCFTHFNIIYINRFHVLTQNIYAKLYVIYHIINTKLYQSSSSHF